MLIIYQILNQVSLNGKKPLSEAVPSLDANGIDLWIKCWCMIQVEE